MYTPAAILISRFLFRGILHTQIHLTYTCIYRTICKTFTELHYSPALLFACLLTYEMRTMVPTAQCTMNSLTRLPEASMLGIQAWAPFFPSMPHVPSGVVSTEGPMVYSIPLEKEPSLGDMSQPMLPSSWGMSSSMEKRGPWSSMEVPVREEGGGDGRSPLGGLIPCVGEHVYLCW